MSKEQDTVTALSGRPEGDEGADNVSALGDAVYNQADEVREEDHHGESQTDSDQESRYCQGDEGVIPRIFEESWRKDSACGGSDYEGDNREKPDCGKPVESVVLTCHPAPRSLGSSQRLQQHLHDEDQNESTQE